MPPEYIFTFDLTNTFPTSLSIIWLFRLQRRRIHSRKSCICSQKSHFFNVCACDGWTHQHQSTCLDCRRHSPTVMMDIENVPVLDFFVLKSVPAKKQVTMIIPGITVLFHSIWHPAWRVTSLPKFWFWQAPDLNVTARYFRQVGCKFCARSLQIVHCQLNYIYYLHNVCKCNRWASEIFLYFEFILLNFQMISALY